MGVGERGAPSATVRPPSAGDLEDVVALLGALGYPTTLHAAEARLRVLAQRTDVAVLVADRSSTVVGLATAHLLHVIHADDPMVILGALVVAEQARGQGIGRRLVRAVEDWGVRRGAYRIVVASGLAREGAHAFYERLGYEHSARRYSRLLVPAE